LIVQALEVLVAVVGGAVVLRGAWSFWRGAGSTAIETLQAANRVLEQRVHELERENRVQASELATLRAKTDFAAALAPIMAWATSHETLAASRSESSLNVLGLIADSLGADRDQAA